MNFTEMSAHYARETDRMTANIFHRLISEGASRESAAEQAEHFRELRQGPGWDAVLTSCRILTGQPAHPPSDSIH